MRRLSDGVGDGVGSPPLIATPAVSFVIGSYGVSTRFATSCCFAFVVSCVDTPPHVGISTPQVRSMTIVTLALLQPFALQGLFFLVMIPLMPNENFSRRYF